MTTGLKAGGMVAVGLALTGGLALMLVEPAFGDDTPLENGVPVQVTDGAGQAGDRTFTLGPIPYAARYLSIVAINEPDTGAPIVFDNGYELVGRSDGIQSLGLAPCSAYDTAGWVGRYSPAPADEITTTIAYFAREDDFETEFTGLSDGASVNGRLLVPCGGFGVGRVYLRYEDGDTAVMARTSLAVSGRVVEGPGWPTWVGLWLDTCASFETTAKARGSWVDISTGKPLALASPIIQGNPAFVSIGVFGGGSSIECGGTDGQPTEVEITVAMTIAPAKDPGGPSGPPLLPIMAVLLAVGTVAGVAWICLSPKASAFAKFRARFRGGPPSDSYVLLE